MTSLDTMSHEDLLHHVKTVAARGNWTETAQVADILRNKFPQDLRGHMWLAECRLNLGDGSGALNILLPLENGAPNEPGIPYFIAIAYAHLYRHDKAYTYLKRAVELRPDWTDARFRLGQNLFKAGRNEEAIPHLTQAAHATPNNFQPAFLLGTALTAIGDYKNALDWMAKAAAANPADEVARRQLAELRDIVKAPPRKERFARWPKSAAEFQDLPKLIRNYLTAGYDTQGFVLNPGMTVLTQGSCFAGNLAKSFRRYDLNVLHIPFGEEHNSTFSNRAVMRWIRDGVTDETTSIIEENFKPQPREVYRDFLARTDLYVYTLGVAPAFFDKETGVFRMSHSTASSKAALVRNNNFRTTTVAENVDNLHYIVSTIRELNPKATIVLTLSPVPLSSTPEMSSAIIADCISKSTLRLAAHEITTQNIPNLLYWPSFEIVRWVGSHQGQVYGSDDGSSHHVNFQIVDTIIDSFIEVIGGPTLTRKE